MFTKSIATIILTIFCFTQISFAAPSNLRSPQDEETRARADGQNGIKLALLDAANAVRTVTEPVLAAARGTKPVVKPPETLQGRGIVCTIDEAVQRILENMKDRDFNGYIHHFASDLYFFDLCQLDIEEATRRIRSFVEKVADDTGKVEYYSAKPDVFLNPPAAAQAAPAGTKGRAAGEMVTEQTILNSGDTLVEERPIRTEYIIGRVYDDIVEVTRVEKDSQWWADRKAISRQRLIEEGWIHFARHSDLVAQAARVEWLHRSAAIKVATDMVAAENSPINKVTVYYPTRGTYDGEVIWQEPVVYEREKTDFSNFIKALDGEVTEVSFSFDRDADVAWTIILKRGDTLTLIPMYSQEANDFVNNLISFVDYTPVTTTDATASQGHASTTDTPAEQPAQASAAGTPASAAGTAEASGRAEKIKAILEQHLIAGRFNIAIGDYFVVRNSKDDGIFVYGLGETDSISVPIRSFSFEELNDMAYSKKALVIEKDEVTRYILADTLRRGMHFEVFEAASFHEAEVKYNVSKADFALIVDNIHKTARKAIEAFGVKYTYRIVNMSESFTFPSRIRELDILFKASAVLATQV